jgi:transcription termination/antitermination protein NusG
MVDNGTPNEGEGSGLGDVKNDDTTATPAPPTAEKKWYIVHTYSGHENKAKLTLLERVRNASLNEYFGDVLVPTESVVENIKGQRRTMTRKFFPGYMFVQMVLDDRTFHLVKNTPKITGFLGGTKPTPVPEREITGVQTNVAEGKAGKPKARVVFEPGGSASSKGRSRASRRRSKK